VVHSSTFGENNLAMAAALGVLELLDQKGLVSRAASLGERLRGRLQESLAGLQLVKDVRGRGLMLAVEFGAPQDLKLRLAWTALHTLNKGLFGQMVTMPLLSEHRILTQVAGHNLDALKLSPPLILTDAQADRFVEALTSVVRDCHRLSGGIWDAGKDLARRAVSEALAPA
jgi:acetylornithine/succinyldiaminopimelate/putrescine aminotransferase